MRTLPWLTTRDGGKRSKNKRAKRKRINPKSHVRVAESSRDCSDSDTPQDVMIAGYDDRFVMVEQDLIKAANLVTHQCHLQAYQKQNAVPCTGKILRPTVGILKLQTPEPVYEDGLENDTIALEELLNQTPPSATVPDTPVSSRARSMGKADERNLSCRINRELLEGNEEDNEDLGRPLKVHLNNESI